MSEIKELKPGILQALLLALYRKLDLVGDQRLLIGDAGPPVRNAPSPLKALGRFISARLAAKKQSSPPVQPDNFKQQVNAALDSMDGQVAGCQWFTVKPNTQNWQATGVRASQGDEYTLLASGMLYLLKALDVGIGPAVGLWYRFGDGEVHKLTRAYQVIRADAAGELQLIAAIPGEFGDPSGKFEADIPRKPMTGEFTVAVVQWKASTQQSLVAAAAQNEALFGPALEDYQQPVRPPEGWQYLWKIGQGEVFTQCTHDDGEALCCHTHADVGILQYPVDVPLTADLEFRWSWLVEQLPSKVPEHIQPSHDYMSIAIEFDNGLDLTYFWSTELPVDTIFQCPLPWWDQRETHWVLRSGEADLGKWLDEKRNVQADYRKAISGPLPNRIVAVWLIANSAFQRGRGDCRYRAISLNSSVQENVIH